MFNVSDDPLGIALAQRARARRQQFNAAADANDDEQALLGTGQSGPQMALGAMQSKFERGRSDAAAQGYNADWDKFFQALQEQKDDADANGMKFRVNTRAIGNPSMDSLTDAQSPPMPEPYDQWSARTKRQIYGPMDSLNRGR